MTIAGSYVFKSVKQMSRERDTLRFDHVVQRNGGLWTNEESSLFIHSLIYGYPFPPVYATEEQPGILQFLDGQQRMTHTFSFIDGEFALGRSTPDVNGIKIKGMKFEDLPADFQDAIMSAMFQIYSYRNLTEDETRELFLRLNGGRTLTAFEKARAWVPRPIAEFVRLIKTKPFFAQSANIAENAKKRFTDEEAIFQIILLMKNGYEGVELYTKTVRAAIRTMRKETLTQSVKDELELITDYCSDAFPMQSDVLRKVNIPPLFVVAKKSLDQGVPPEDFGKWAQAFLRRQNGQTIYGYAAILGSASKGHVQTRIREMEKDFERHFEVPAVVVR